jgi:poly(beta-D-mannuronate) lyase
MHLARMKPGGMDVAEKVSLVFFLCFFFGSAASASAASACKAPPAAIIDFNTVSYYTDAHHSEVDPALKQEEKAETKPVKDFEKGVARDASAFSEGDSEAGSCALSWLSDWAGKGAFLGKMGSGQAYDTQKWLLASVALSYGRLKQRATPKDAAQIENWLKALADRVMADTEQKPNVRNNHYYWNGLAVTAVGAVTHEQKYLDFGSHVFETAMGQISHDGSLPLELKRAKKAARYHAFASGALVMMSSILDQNSPQLDRLVEYTFNSVRDPGAVESKAGAAQEPVRPVDVEWLRIYLRRRPNSQMAAFESSQPPHLDELLGGYLNLANPLEHAQQ